ncbi:hypothetical protein HYT57_01120 [Candidatus Woesearchaeota archaeon]|nr:hypothetical protein [Candidatus Woesearchaeota archaeon]
MARCIKCNYLLVLLPKRNKYKCPRCSSLFPEKEIDNKEFRIYNQRQRDIDREELEFEIKQYKEEKLKRRLERQKKLQKKLWRQNNNEHYREWKKQHRLKQIEKIRQQDRIQFWRKQQKALVLQRLENEQYKASKHGIRSSGSTYLTND